MNRNVLFKLMRGSKNSEDDMMSDSPSKSSGMTPNRLTTKRVEARNVERKDKREKLLNRNFRGTHGEVDEEENGVEAMPTTIKKVAAADEKKSSTFRTLTNAASAQIRRAITFSTPSTTTSNSTFLVDENGESGVAVSGPRKKLLDDWRKQKRENEARVKATKPVFKVQHVDEKLFEKSAMLATGPKLPTSSSFTFHVNLYS